MARSKITRRSLKRLRRRSYHEINPRFRTKFKNRRGSRCLNLDAKEAEESEGVWPIVPYIAPSTNQSSMPSLCSLPCSSKTRRPSCVLRRQKPQRFNIFENLVEEKEQRKKGSDFNLSSLTVEANNSAILEVPSGSKPSTSNCSAKSGIISSTFSFKADSVVNGTARETASSTGGPKQGDLIFVKSGTLEEKLLKQNLRRLRQPTNLSAIAETPETQSVTKASHVEVITLEEDEKAEYSGKSALESVKITNNEVTIIKEIVNSSKAASAPSDLIFASLRMAASEILAANMSSYSYRVLRQFVYDLKSVPLRKMDLSHLPFADARMIFPDILSEGTAREARRLLRRWEEIQKLSSWSTWFRICSYNVLCQDTMEKTSFLYKHLRGSSMSWDIRSALLAREFAMMGADIYCLQEVQDVHFYDFYSQVFSSLGYTGVFKKRTRENVDGCAIFFNSRFELVSYVPIEYFVGKGCVLDRDNIAQVARFREKRSGREFCVANTHLLYNTRRGDVKLAQLAVLLAHMDKICGPSSSRPCPYLMCGDFNMRAYCPIYNFVLEGFLNFKDLRRHDLSGQGHNGGPAVRSDFISREANIDMQCRFIDGYKKVQKDRHWTHGLNFASVHTHIDAYDQPEISSYNCIEALNPDFLFYSVDRKTVEDDAHPDFFTMNVHENSLKLLRRLSLPNEEALRSTLGPWPNFSAPSDHAPVVADFALL